MIDELTSVEEQNRLKIKWEEKIKELEEYKKKYQELIDDLYKARNEFINMYKL